MTAGGSTPDLFGDVPAEVRLEMERIALLAPSENEALTRIVALILGDVPAQQLAAVEGAIKSNDQLDQQWRRAYEALTGRRN